ncbi:MAG: helix-turn-helix transcriptional regulator [Erysipelotrichaceae bacterium]|nr:helix-turn-helix transcriptional regulator [Erysipelotrichaceae bacterium]MBR3355976.1 helix-turn-helix transcriptional regulator [Oscillospiraceae bacterium]
MENERILISDYVRGLRAKEGLTLEEFGKKYGLSRAGASRYENGNFDNPSLLIATKFCKIFNIDLDEFVVDFYYTNEKIDKAFTTAKHFAERFGPEFFDPTGKGVITRFYQRFKDEYSLHGLKNVSEDDDAKNRKCRNYIPRYGICYNKKNEEIWIYRFLNSFEGINKYPLNYRYNYLNQVVSTVAAHTKKELGCKNYVFIIPNKKMLKYLVESEFNKTETNAILIYSKDDRNFEEPILLFGKDFLKQK